MAELRAAGCSDRLITANIVEQIKAVTSLRVTPDGDCAVTGSESNTAPIWRAHRRREGAH
eukprot:6176391-Pleurochrysis_carterae.AAC.2